MGNYWVNIDTWTRRYIVHKHDCKYVVSQVEGAGGTEKKPIGSLGANGGWLNFDSPEAAEQFFRETWPARKLTVCAVCWP